MNKTIDRIYAPPHPHFVGDGFRVHNFIPSQPGLLMERMNPFVMLDYNSRHFFPPTQTAKGVGVHPHRGFETVTIAFEGSIAHHDSAGNSGVIYPGDVQWMTAGSGILHKEYHEETFAKKGGHFHMVQLWVNLPADHKMTQPKYQEITADMIPQVPLDEGKGYVRVIAGQWKNATGPAETFTPIHMYNLHMQGSSQQRLHFPEGYNTLILVVQGSIQCQSQRIDIDHLVSFKSEGEDIHISAEADSILLVLSAEPLREPIAAHGPFVMNSRTEIQEAFLDFQQGAFGHLD